MLQTCRIALALGVLAVSACTTMAAREPVTVKLIAFNDFHGALNPTGPNGGVAWLAGRIGQLKAQNPLNAVVAAGDLIGASPMESALFHDEPSIEALNVAGLEFSSVGNHEFDDGVAELKRMQAGGCAADAPEKSCHGHQFTGARFQYLAANVIDTASGKPLFPAFALKTFDLGSGRRLKIGFIGAVLRSVPDLVMREAVRTLTFTDEATAVNAAVPALRAQGADVIVLLIHEGGLPSAKAVDDTTCPDFKGGILPILERLDPAVSVVISGHTHRTYICRRNGRLVTSAGLQGRYLTDVELQIDPSSRRLIDASATQIAVTNDGGPSNAAVQAIADAYTTAAAPFAQRAVAESREDITRVASAAGESALGDLVADAHLAATSAAASGGAQLAFMNASGIRTDLRPQDGRISYGAITAVHPFGNALVTLTLTGAQIHELLEEQWTSAAVVGSGMLQVSAGFTYEWRADGAPGAKVDPASIRLNGATVEPTERYRVTVNEFLAGGSDGFKVFADGTDRLRGVLDSEALERYLAEHSPVSAPRLARIRCK
jgi:5'-nucleotidase